MYNKLFTKIVDSSIWLESLPTRMVWITFLAVMDEDGFAALTSVGNVAHRARVTADEAQIAIDVLEGPDENSGNPDHEGRRIERVDGGWLVLNAKAHRDMVTRDTMLAQTRERVRRYREKKRGSNASVTPSEKANDLVTPSEAYTHAHAEVKKNTRADALAGFDAFWALYPKKKAKTAAMKAWTKLQPDADLQRDILGAVREQITGIDWNRDGGQYIPHPASWLNGARWHDTVDVAVILDQSKYDRACPNDPPCPVGTTAFRCHQRAQLEAAKAARTV